MTILRDLLGTFLFSGDDIHKKVGVLSGGEKSRLALAKMLLRPSNLLLLDEPTNHLDLFTKDVLLDALQSFSGTLVFVSHDRYFVNALATRTVAVGGGGIVSYPGNYDDYLEKTGSEPAASVGANRGAESTELTGAAAEKSSQKKERLLSREEEKRRQREERSRLKRLSELEMIIETAEQELALLEQVMGEPDYFSDVERSREGTKKHDALTYQITTLYNEWETLHVQDER